MPPRQGNAFLGFRATPEYHERVETAAARMELEKATWLRLVVDAALNFDETVMTPAPLATGGIVPASDVAAVAIRNEVNPEELFVPTTGAADVRIVEVVNTSLNPSKPNPRDCPHPPQYRMGMRCNRCGSIVGKGAPRR